ncbi:MAG: hypothetical protein AB8G11_03335 [Saprospiraceae bacterium]
MQPFSRDYRSVFFGRSDDIEGLYKYLNVHKLTVLHGKSGLGKSSLLNAGLIPKFEENNNFLTVFVRFGSYQDGSTATPKSIFVNRIKEELIDENSLFFEDLNLKNPSIWQYFKTLQWDFQDFDGVLLVLDQFEEVFTYPKAAVEEFGREFSELVNDRIPEDFQKRLYETADNSNQYLENNADKIQFTNNDMALKILVGIRSDRLSYLDRLSDYLPNILKNLYGLLPLNRTQAREAIAAPAQKQLDDLEKRLFGNVAFATSPFAYNSAFLDHILDFLSKGYHQTIEPFLLQIICQEVEAVVQQRQLSTISKTDIDSLDNVVQNYYTNIVKGTTTQDNQATNFTEFEQLIVRYLVETQLINTSSTPNTRISLDQAVLEKRGATTNILTTLVDKRLLRQEPNTVSGMSYEVSHDTLIDPILQSALALGDLEEQLTNYYKMHVSEKGQYLINAYFLFGEDLGKNINFNDFKPLLQTQIVRKGDADFELYAMFKDIATKLQNERNAAAIQAETTKRKRATGLAILAGIVGVIAIVLFFYGQKQRLKAEENFGVAMQEKAAKDKQDVEEILRIGTSFEEAEYYQDAKMLYDSATVILQKDIHLEYDTVQTNSLMKELERRIDEIEKKE